MGMLRLHGWQGIHKQLVDRRPHQLRRGVFQKPLPRRIDQRDAAIQPRRHQPAADRVDDVFMQHLQAFQRPAGVFELHAYLPELGRQQAGEVCNCQKGEQVNKDNRLQRRKSRVRGAIRRNYGVVVQLQN